MDADDARGTGGSHRAPEIGSLAEEAAKLFAAITDYAQQHSGGAVGTATSAAGAATDALRNLNEHIATDSVECKYCPVCQVIHVVRATSPEVRTHLLSAGASLAQAAAGMLATAVPTQDGQPVQKINLDDEWDES